MPQSPPPPPDSPLVQEVSTLFGLLAEAFALDGERLARALETGAMTLVPGEDAKGKRFVRATLTEADPDLGPPRRVRIYQSALYHEPLTDTPAPDEPEADPTP